MRLAIPTSCQFALAALAAWGVLSSGCSPEKPDTALARVGDAEITVDDFNRHLQARQKGNPAPVDRKALLEELVQREVLVQNALKAGLQDDPEVREMVRDIWIAKLKERQLTPQLQAAAVTDDELKTAYETEKAKLMKPERVRLAMLFVSSPPEADPEAQQETKRRLVAAAQSGAQQQGGAQQGFGPIAVNHSEDQESRYRGGEIGWVERERFSPRLDPIVVQTGFALQEPGQISEVVTGRDGFFVVKLLERQPASAMPLEQAEPALRRRLVEAKQEQIQSQFEDNLRTALRIEMHPERLDSLPAPAPEAPPPSPSIP